MTVRAKGAKILRFPLAAAERLLTEDPSPAFHDCIMPSRDENAGPKLDAFRLARDRGVLEGTVDAHTLARVADVLGEGPANVGWRIEGTSDAEGRAALDIEVRGNVSLTCQRCLDDFDWPIEQHTEVLLARDERELAALDAQSSSEVVLAERPLHALALVEDELLLALPFAPRHPDGACRVDGG